MIWPWVVTLLLVSGLDCAEEESKKQTSARVLIVGAGMTGTLAGKTLHESGMEDFLILESATRVGGRMWNIPFGGITVEIGANFIHGGGPNNPVFQRAQDLDMDLRISRYFSYTVRDNEGNDITDEADDVFETLDPSYEAAEDHSYELLCENPEKSDTSFRRILAQYGWEPKNALEETLDFFYTEFDVAQYVDGCSTRYFYEWGLNDDFLPIDYTVTDSRGYSSVVQSFMDDFIQSEDDNRLVTGARVTSITQNETHVTATTSNGDEYTGEYLLSTVSLGVLQSDQIAFDPIFNEAKFEAVMQHHMSLYLTAYLKFDESEPPFWDSTEWILNAGPRRRYWNIFMNLDSTHPGSNILQASVIGEEAKRVERLSNAQVQVEIMEVLRSMYGPDIPEPQSILVPRWSQLTSFMGSYSDWPTGYNLEQNRALREAHGRVHFAGEAMSSRYFGYVHGAYFEGIRGAEFLMGCMDGGDCEMPIANECPTDGKKSKRKNRIPKRKRGLQEWMLSLGN